MNFFQHQEAAKKKTGLLIVLMIGAIVSLIIITTLLVGVLMYYFQSHASSIHAISAYNTPFTDHFLRLIQSPLLAYIAIGISSLVLLGSFFKWLQLRNGGRYVAESLGGHLLSHNTNQADEKKVLNIVEEMAIASGNPVPLVFLLEEPSINAFAAGLSRRDAVIGVTRGCIELLNRDELQGVIAHEFSHIHNGDMRLNLKLIAFIHGILVIGLIGELLMSSGRYSFSRNQNKSRGAQLSIGLALLVVGYGGTFFGNIIKAAVSRQREFLADASAVQFTRNPDGIGGALKKIGGHAYGARLNTGGASEFSHLYFGQGVALKFNAMMATHPPLEQRIRRISPNWNGKFIEVKAPIVTPSRTNQTASPLTASLTNTDMQSPINIDEVIEHIGEVDEDSLAKSQQCIHSLPTIIENAVHNPYSARALIYCLLLDKDKNIRAKQINTLSDQAHPNTFVEMKRLYKPMQRIKRSQYLIITDLCIPALKLLSDSQRHIFIRNLVSLIKEDRTVSLFEWCLYRITRHNIEPPQYRSLKTLKDCQESINLILSATALVTEDDIDSAFAHGCQRIKMPTLQRFNGYSYNALDNALNELATLKPLEKPALLKALMAVIHHNKKVTPQEAELFRAIADTLDCPVPPFYASE